MRKKAGFGEKAFDVFNITFMVILILATAYPFFYIVSISLSSPNAVMANKVIAFPVEFTLDAYEKVMRNAEFWVSYKNTFIYAFLGTLIKLTGTTLLAYPLSKKRLLFRKGLSYFAAFTLYFSGGMVPWFLLISYLHMRNNLWGMVIPGAVSIYYAIILRTHFQTGIPVELEESAKMDGLGNVGILTRIYLPLSKPVYATLFLFFCVDIWNSYFNALLLLNNKSKYPLQVYLRNLIASGVIQDSASLAGTGDLVVPQSLKGASIVVAMLPIMMIYPFIQKYFVKGVMIGSIKG